MKKLKRIFLILMMSIFLIGGLATSQISYAAINDEVYLKAVHIRKGGWGYSTGDDGDGNPKYNIEKIKQYVEANSNAEVNENSILYCIKGGIGFGAGENTASIEESSETTTYTELGNFINSSTLSNIRSTYGNYLSDENYYKLVWLLDNLYTKIGEDDETSKANFLTSIGGLSPKGIYETKDSNRHDLNIPSSESGYGWNDILNDDDIDVVQQLAIWHFTNPNEDHYDFYQADKGADHNQLTWIKLINSLGLTDIIEEIDIAYNPDDGNEITEEQYRENQLKNVRYNFIRELYANLIEKAETNGTAEYFANRDNESSPISLGKLDSEKSNGYYIAGPYNIPDEYKDKNYTLLSTNFTDENGNNINDKIAILVGNIELNRISDPTYLAEHIKRFDTITKDDIEAGNIYIAISYDNAKNINSVKFDLNFSYTMNEITYYSAGSETQPVVKIEPKDYNITFNGEFSIPKEFDLALRKYITKVTKTNGTVNELTGTSSREPHLEDEDIAEIETNGTANYKHRKDPVTVETGDRVTYKITIYNEGNQDGYATKITDQLPTGLKFVRVLSGNFEEETYNESGDNTLRLKRLDTSITPLNAFDGTNLDSETVEIECEVTANPDEGDTTILTNVAWISEEVNTEGDPTTLITTQIGKDRDSQPGTTPNVTKNNMSSYKGNETNPSVTPASSNTYYKGEQDDDDFEKLQILPKTFDLTLRKFITQKTKVDGTVEKYDGTNTREPQIAQAELEKLLSVSASLDNGTTAVKTHTKDPVAVETGDIVRYTIRVYNEGQVDGTADEITDYLPDGLELVPQSESDTNKKYGWVADTNNNKKITTNYLENVTLKAFTSTKVDGEYKIDYKDVEIECKVTKTVTQNDQSLKNVAEITASSNTANLPDRDSVINNVNNNNYNPENSRNGKGEQDDDDYEELILRGKNFDLALRKFITQITKVDGTVEKYDGTNTREPQITQAELGKLISGTSNLDNGTTAIKTHTKHPVQVKTGDIVRYTIRIYNEGGVEGTANKITDYLPDGLELVPQSESDTNKKYGWVADTNDSKKITTNYLENVTLKAFTSTKVDGEYKIDYKDVEIECKVTKIVSQDDQSLKNVAEITEYSNDANLPDRDSKELVNHNTTNSNYNPTNPTTGRGEEDDDDYEELKLSQFDLALRKFITAINETPITTRIPVPDTTKLQDGTSKTAEYNHSKEPLLVKNSSIVTYTIRVYNEGEIEGYASKIKDDIPKGLEFLPDNKTNKAYRWVMLDKDGKVTEDISEAVSIVTDYLSKEQEEERLKDASEGIDNLTSLIPAYDKENDKLYFKDVQVAFKVIEPVTSDRIIINQAQISANEDKNGENITDRDSTPDKWLEEDDEDIEKVKVQYFDLSLRKWVTQAIVNDNGEITTTETNHKAEDDPESIVKVEIKDKKLNSVIIKFKYKIRVTNEGTIAGYATEIKDYIPAGLKFIAEDNPTWTQIDDKTIVTDQAKDILLQSGESTEVEVILTWINSEENLALQMNYAEISEDFNEFDAPDIDSTPNNQKYGEDDIDEAPVLLSIKTGEARIYFVITGSVLLIIIIGVSLIKKYVI